LEANRHRQATGKLVAVHAPSFFFPQPKVIGEKRDGSTVLVNGLPDQEPELRDACVAYHTSLCSSLLTATLEPGGDEDHETDTRFQSTFTEPVPLCLPHSILHCFNCVIKRHPRPCLGRERVFSMRGLMSGHGSRLGDDCWRLLAVSASQHHRRLSWRHSTYSTPQFFSRGVYWVIKGR
jgi:hypothetical protein